MDFVFRWNELSLNVSVALVDLSNVAKSAWEIIAEFR